MTAINNQLADKGFLVTTTDDRREPSYFVYCIPSNSRIGKKQFIQVVLLLDTNVILLVMFL